MFLLNRNHNLHLVGQQAIFFCLHTDKSKNCPRVEKGFGSVSLQFSLDLSNQVIIWWRASRFGSFLWNFLRFFFSFKISRPVDEVIPDSHERQRPLWLQTHTEERADQLQVLAWQWVVSMLSCVTRRVFWLGPVFRVTLNAESDIPTCFPHGEAGSPESQSQSPTPTTRNCTFSSAYALELQSKRSETSSSFAYLFYLKTKSFLFQLLPGDQSGC